MIKQASFYAVLLTVAFVGSVAAQQPNPYRASMPLEFDWSKDEPIVRGGIVTGMTDLQKGETPGQAVLTSIITWVSNTLDLPAIYDQPHVERAPKVKLTAALHGSPLVSQRGVLSMYDDAKHTIYLPEDWSGQTPEGISILIHEMVHHLQNIAGLKYECPQGREKLAYVAQERWLSMSGRSLEKDFGIDPLTYLLSTECYLP
jgi:uncharacterized protein DUF6647